MSENNKNPNSLKLIRARYSAMSEVERKIADRILADPERVLNMTVRLLANEAAVSEGSVVNFANLLGFDGFTKLKINLAQSIGSAGNPVFENLSESDRPQDALRKMTVRMLESFGAACGGIREEEFIGAAEMLESAEGRIEIYGVGGSMPVAMDAYYRLMRAGLPAYAVTDAVLCTVSASKLQPGCIAFGISNSGCTEEILRPLRIAKSRGAKTILLTGNPDSPGAKLCDCAIAVPAGEAGIYREAAVARLVQVFIIDSLCAWLGSRRGEEGISHIEEFIDLMDEHFYQ